MLAGCVEKGGESTDTNPEFTTEPSTGGTQAEPTGPTEAGVTEAGVTEATETDGTEPGDSESDTPAETDGDTEQALPEECAVQDGSVKAQFSLALGEWPDMSDDGHDIDVKCTIDTMTLGPDSIEHAFTCDDGGTPRPVTLRVPLAIGGSVVWKEGDMVRLEARAEQDVDFSIDSHEVRMFAADETPLLVAGFGGSENGPNLAPLVYKEEYLCGPQSDEGDLVPLAVRFELGAEAVAIFHGNRDILAIEGSTEVFAIDLEEATGNWCCHYGERYAVLAQRVSPL